MRVCKNHANIVVPKERCFSIDIPELKGMDIVVAQTRVAEMLVSSNILPMKK